MKTVYIAWKDAANTRAWFPIGRLDADLEQSRYLFRYTRGAKVAQVQCGFQPLDAFPVFEQLYESSELFPLFSNRVQNANRPSFKEYLQRLDFSWEAPDAIELLGMSEGKRATDNLEVFPKVERTTDGRFAMKFFMHGWRHIHPYAVQRMETLQPGEPLGVSVEVNNPKTGLAIQLLTQDYVMIGWAPRYLFQDFARIIFEGVCEVEASVARYNPPPAPPVQRLMVEFKGCWPASYEPMSAEEFQPLAPLPIEPAPLAQT